MKVALCQMLNTVDIETNFRVMENHFRYSKAEGASFIAFPECSLTGFHGKVRNTPAEKVHFYLKEFAGLCQKFEMAGMVPLILPDEDGGFLNAAFVFDELGNKIFELHKISLTESEKLFFKVGQKRPRQFQVLGKKFSVLFCFEIHSPEIIAEIATSDSDAVLWPAYWGWGRSVDWQSDTEKGQRIRAHITQCKKPFLQVNYCTDPRTRTPEEALQGNSIVCDDSGKLISTAGLYQDEPLIVNIDSLKSASQIETGIPASERSSLEIFESVEQKLRAFPERPLNSC